jgi:hypothetical protein
MKKPTLCAFLVLALGAAGLARADAIATETLSHGPVLAEKAPKPNTGKGFEKATWRMTPKALTAAYPTINVGADGNYAVSEDVDGYPALVIFYFADHFGLARIYVLFKDSIASAPDALRIFNDMEDKLKKKYGLPSQSWEYWRVKPTKITDGAREQSIATGGLQMASTWAGARTWILLDVSKRANQDRPGTSLTFLSTDGPLKKEWLQQNAAQQPPSAPEDGQPQ